METHREYMDSAPTQRGIRPLTLTKLLYPAAGIQRDATPRDGNIASFVSYPTDAPPAYPEMRPGQQLLEVDAASDFT
jgi:hypothetical protein